MANEKLLWYKPAVQPNFKMKKQGTYAKGYPEGAVVHFTAGHYDTPNQAISELTNAKDKFLFLLIDYNGIVYQTNNLSEWGSHAGISTYKGLGDRLSNKLVGIEISNVGSVTKKKDGNFYSYFGKLIPAELVREVPVKNANQQVGYYQKYSEAQEKALVDLLVWLHTNNPAVFKIENILGHDEISPGRKNDPGGSLSMTMPQLRELVKSKIISTK